MGFIDPAKNEINCKVVYVGPALAGKSTSIQYIYNNTATEFKNKLTLVSTDSDRFIFCDITSPKWKKIHGYSLRLHLYTVPGAIFYGINRLKVLRGVDAVIFVADSQIGREDNNNENFYLLQQHLKLLAYDFKSLPYVLQINKRDLNSIHPVKEVIKEIFYLNEPVIQSVAYKGIGVFEAFNPLVEQVIDKLSNQSLEKFHEHHRSKTKNEIDQVQQEHLINILQTDTDNHMRSSAAVFLGEFDDIKLFDLLVPYLDDPNDMVKLSIINALKKWDKERAADIMLKYKNTFSDFIKDSINCLFNI